MSIKEAYCASWIIPVSSPPMREAALIVENGVIQSVLPAYELRNGFKGIRIHDFPYSVIMPAWVNAHTHLELSWLKNQRINSGSFVSWVEQLLKYRLIHESQEEAERAARSAMEEMRRQGTALAGDITNGRLLAKLPDEPVERAVFFEILGFIPDDADEIFEQAKTTLNSINPSAVLTPHAPYSTSAELLKRIGKFSPRLSVHAAESPEEFRFFTENSGPMIDFLKQLGVWNEKWQPPFSTPVSYLADLGILNENSILVHGVQVTEEDVRIIKNTKAAVCLCARSNALLNVGKPPVQKYLENGIPLCVGTDSLASNTSLDMNEELFYLFEHFDFIEPEILVQMATLNGARALGKDHLYGSLDAGKKAAFNVFTFNKPITENPESAVVSRTWSEMQWF
ncbi:MAG: amidohydrolase family protein [Calditrichaeota bacterium]|nr:amidohydrolase family protein [Calditrichota bacterium]